MIVSMEYIIAYFVNCVKLACAACVDLTMCANSDIMDPVERSCEMTRSRIAPMVRFRRQLLEHVNRAVYGHERIIITYHGKPHAILIGVDDFAAIEDEISKLKDQISSAGNNDKEDL